MIFEGIYVIQIKVHIFDIWYICLSYFKHMFQMYYTSIHSVEKAQSFCTCEISLAHFACKLHKLLIFLFIGNFVVIKLV